MSRSEHFVVDDEVRVADGPFARFNGTVIEVDDWHDRLTVMVSVYGRATPVELKFEQVEKIRELAGSD
jgi:transcriptional antiterminator NusG